MVYYRKYRPQKIADLDNATVREKLTAALSSETIPHAFLFTGPKGLGKTSTARIVAKVVNCEKKGKNIEPCNKCDQCISITSGTNLDVLEIDGASNRGIDEIRDLQEKIGLSPFGAKKKVYIIDEVHMLTLEAFNALLKTLEEPPSHALFILCTTESHKVPSTIVSRCFQISFSLATAEELVRSFNRIIIGEKLTAEEDALLEIAKLSDGSFRDGAKILEELVSQSEDKKITKELVDQKYQVLSIKYQVDGLLKVLSQKDVKGGLQIVSKINEQGVDMKYFVEQLIAECHRLLLVNVGIKEEEKIEDGKWKIEDIKKLVELLTKAHQEIKYAVLPQLPLELVIIQWSTFVGAEVAHKNFLVAHAKNHGSEIPDLNPANSHNENFVGSPRQKSSSVTGGKEKNENRDFWFSFLDSVKKESHTMAGVLRGCSLLRYDEKELIIETRFKFHKEKLEENKAREILEQAGKEVTGKDVKVLVVLKGGD